MYPPKPPKTITNERTEKKKTDSQPTGISKKSEGENTSKPATAAMPLPFAIAIITTPIDNLACHLSINTREQSRTQSTAEGEGENKKKKNRPCHTDKTKQDRQNTLQTGPNQILKLSKTTTNKQRLAHSHSSLHPHPIHPLPAHRHNANPTISMPCHATRSHHHPHHPSCHVMQ